MRVCLLTLAALGVFAAVLLLEAPASADEGTGSVTHDGSGLSVASDALPPASTPETVHQPRGSTAADTAGGSEQAPRHAAEHARVRASHAADTAHHVRDTTEKHVRDTLADDVTAPAGDVVEEDATRPSLGALGRATDRVRKVGHDEVAPRLERSVDQVGDRLVNPLREAAGSTLARALGELDDGTSESSDLADADPGPSDRAGRGRTAEVPDSGSEQGPRDALLTGSAAGQAGSGPTVAPHRPDRSPGPGPVSPSSPALPGPPRSSLDNVQTPQRGLHADLVGLSAHRSGEALVRAGRGQHPPRPTGRRPDVTPD